MTHYLSNPHRNRSLRFPAPTLAPQAFHRGLPGYERTPLHSLLALAEELGLAELYVKNESRRLTLPAFKVLGASWAVFRWACEELGHTPWDWETVDDLRSLLAPLGRRTLVTATDGNHGRGVAKTAAWLGWHARVFIPAGTVPARIRAIEAEGAEVTVVDGSYDDTVTVAHAAAETPGALLVQDTAWPGYETIPGWIVDGYSTLLWEIEDALRDSGRPYPDLVVMPVGVGSLAAAMAKHFLRADRPGPAPLLVTVEPLSACCLLESLRAGESISVPPEGGTIMAGLNCGTLASLAWPVLRGSVDLALALEDRWAVEAMAAYHRHGIESGESGASSLAALLALSRHPALAEARDAFRIGPNTRALVVNTEGITDPDSPALPSDGDRR